MNIALKCSHQESRLAKSESFAMNTILAEVDPTQSGIVLLHQQKPSQSYITYIDTPSFEMH